MRIHRIVSVIAQVLVLVCAVEACQDDDAQRAAAPDSAAPFDSAANDSVASAEDGTENADSGGSSDGQGPDAGPGVEGPVLDKGCNPLRSGGDCLLPYPSDVFLVDDKTMPSGRRVQFSQEALLTNHDGAPFDLTHLWADDGWSHSPTLLALFPEGIAAKHFVPYASDLSASVADDSETLIIDAATGERILHVAEVDARAIAEDDTLFVLRPQVRLANEHRYVVAIRGLTTPAGDPVAPPAGFKAIRDGSAAPGTPAERLMTRYEQDVFPVLAAAGVQRSELLLAWDFTTRSQENATHDLQRVRDLALAAMKTAPPTATVTHVDEAPNDEALRVVHGTLAVPRYVTDDEAGSRLVRDEAGEVVQNGVATVPFVVIIPKRDDLSGGSLRALQFGHGFFGDRMEAAGGFARGFAQEKGFVVFAVDWWGMNSADQSVVATNMFEAPEDTLLFVERLHQGMVNQLALTIAAQTTIAALPELKVEGQLPYDPSSVYFYGISQGHILGGTLMALTPTIEKAALSVGGAGFSHMMMRSANFILFLALMQQHATEKAKQTKFVAMTQQTCDRFDPITWAPQVLDGSGTDRPKTVQLLLQTGLGDPQVPNMTARLHARALGIPLLAPAHETPAGLTVQATPVSSALVEFDFGVESPRPGDLSLPQADQTNPVHEGVRRSAAGQAQIDAFLRPGGVITNTCAGTCDPE